MMSAESPPSPQQRHPPPAAPAADSSAAVAARLFPARPRTAGADGGAEEEQGREDAVGQPDGGGRQRATEGTRGLTLWSAAFIGLCVAVLCFYTWQITEGTQSAASAAMVLPIILAPTACFFGYWRRTWRGIISGDLLLRRYALGVLPFPFLLMVQLIMGSLPVMFVSSLRFPGNMTWLRMGLLWFLFFLCLTLPEETLKYLVAIARFRTPDVDSKAYLLGSLAVTTGFATAQALFLTWIKEIVEERGGVRPGYSPGDLLIVALATSGLLVPLHLITGYVIGLRLAKAKELSQEVPAVAVLPTPVLLRTASLWVYFAFGAIGGTPGAVLCLAVPTVCVLFPAIAYARRLERRMPPSYLRRVGYMNVFGYGRLAQVEDLDAVEMTSYPAGATEPKTAAGYTEGEQAIYTPSIGDRMPVVVTIMAIDDRTDPPSFILRLDSGGKRGAALHQLQKMPVEDGSVDVSHVSPPSEPQAASSAAGQPSVVV